jgi:Uma2 family endonuclease
MTKPTASRWTYRDYLALPDDGRQYELIDGELLLNPSPVPRHQRVSFRLAVLLDAYLGESGLGILYPAPSDVVLSDDTVVQPDILVFLNEHRSRTTENGHFGPPDLAVEVLSPGTAERDRVRKLELYGRYGVREYWIVDPEARAIEIYGLDTGRLGMASTHDSGEVRSVAVLPGFSASLAEIFQEP